MKQSEIEVGVEYAYKPRTWRTEAIQVTVLDKGLDYGDARGRGVRVRFHVRGYDQVVLASKIVMIWDEYEHEMQCKENNAALREARAKAVGARVIPLQAKIDALGLKNVKVSHLSRGRRLFIRFEHEDDIDQFMEVLDAAKTHLDAVRHAPIMIEIRGEEEAEQW